jgi:hypothetical protein
MGDSAYMFGQWAAEDEGEASASAQAEYEQAARVEAEASALLDARANQAYNAVIDQWNREHPDWPWMGYDHQRDAFERGWVLGYRARRSDQEDDQHD